MNKEGLALLLLQISILAGCANVKLDPYGRAYSDENLMRPMALDLACKNGSDYDKAPFLESGTQPLYPLHNLWLSKQGSAIVKFTISDKGKVTVAKYSSADHQAFADHAAIAMRDWKVRPAERNGKPVEAGCSLEFTYKLYGSTASLLIQPGSQRQAVQIAAAPYSAYKSLEDKRPTV